MLHSSIIMAQRDRHLNTALPLVNCLKLVRGFAVWFVGPEVCVECVCGCVLFLTGAGIVRKPSLSVLFVGSSSTPPICHICHIYVHILTGFLLLVDGYVG